MIHQCSQCGYLQHSTDGNCKKCSGPLAILGGEKPAPSPPKKAPAQYGFSLADLDEDIDAPEGQKPIDISGIINVQMLQDPLIGQTVGQLTIEEKLGAGGFGAVYRASHHDTKEPFAVKVLHSTQTQQAYFIERFKREARALSHLSHENIVQLADFGVLPGNGLYLAMEFVEGSNLGECIDRKEPFPLPRIRNIAEQLCQVLAYIHSKGVVHRDIKPSNIMLVQRGGVELVKLIDFGIASNLQEHESLTGTGTLLGTARFMSPEQAMGQKQIGPSSDLYAMAVIVFLLLTRRLPVEANSPAALLLRKVRIPPATLHDRVPDQEWTSALESFMAGALAIDPEQRPSDALAFWDEFAQATSDQQTEATVIAKKAMPFLVGSSKSTTSESLFDHTPTRIDRDSLVVSTPTPTPRPSPKPRLAAEQPGPAGRSASDEKGPPPSSIVEPTIHSKLPISSEGLAMPDAKGHDPNASTWFSGPPPAIAPRSTALSAPEESAAQPSGSSPTPSPQTDSSNGSHRPPEIDALAQLSDAEDVALSPARQGPGIFLWAVLVGLLAAGAFWFVAGDRLARTGPGAARDAGDLQPIHPGSAPTRSGPATPQQATASRVPPGRLPPLRTVSRSRRVMTIRPAPPRARKLIAAPRRRTTARRRRRALRRRRSRRQTPCRSLPSSHRWIWATMRTPARAASAVSIRFPGCRRCLLKRKGRGACLGLPKGKGSASVLVATDGYQSCLHRLSSRTRKLRWSLKKPQDIMTLRYKCTRSYR